MSLMHNKAYYAAAAGDVWTGDSTVDTNELKTEFGKYVSSDKISIFNKLVGPISCTGYMSTIITDKLKYVLLRLPLTPCCRHLPRVSPRKANPNLLL